MDRASRRVLAVAVAVLLSAGACSSAERRPAAAPPPDTPIPVAPPPTQPPAPATTLAPLPRPAFIPPDSYAPEPVIEIGTIEIPAIGLTHPVYQGVTLHNIDLGPSHWTGTALPGQRGNTVFAGHRVTNTAPFRDIDRLKNGDEVVFTVDGARAVYRVNGNLVVEPTETWIGAQTEGFTGTLYTCHPPGSLAYRYVVKMELAHADPT